MQLLSQMRRLVAESRTTLENAQARYKRDFDKRVRPLAAISDGYFVYLERQAPSSQDTPSERRRHKLSPKADGYYQVVGTTDNTVTILRDGMNEKVSRDRITKAPPVPTDHTGSDHQESTPQSGPTQNKGGSTNEKEYVFDHIVDFNTDSDLFRVRWHGYSAEEDTWEPPNHLPFNAIASYFRRNNREMPSILLTLSANQ